MALPEPLEPVFVNDPLPAALNEERTAINSLSEEVTKRILLPGGLQTGDLLVWDGTQIVSTETRFLEGNGRPDGVVAAPPGSRYIDKTGADGAVEWVKRAGADSNVGWFCIAGDTLVRNIAALIDKGNGTVHAAYVSRVGNTVDMFLDLTMPSNKTATWTLFAALPGFGPGYNRLAALQDNNEAASSGGTALTTAGGVIIYGVQGGKRDRFTGTWTTRDPWPQPLPGAAT